MFQQNSSPSFNQDENQQQQLQPASYQSMDEPPFQILSSYDAVLYINKLKLTRMAAQYNEQIRRAFDDGDRSQQQCAWIRPCGPRRRGEGLDDLEQGVLYAGLSEEGVKIMFTQLLAGFIIGPNGSSIRDLMRRIGCSVKSYTQNIMVSRPIRVRVFIVSGREDQVVTCLDVMLAAVDRYKDLAEGCYQGCLVQRIQKIKGYLFYYYPPPKNVVPNAAAIRGSPPSKQTKVAKALLGFQSTGSYLAYLDSICNKIAKPQTSTGLTECIRASLESPPEDIDDLGCVYPGLLPGRIYVENTTDQNQLDDFDSQVSGLARAVHLKESLEVSSSFNISENDCSEGLVLSSGSNAGVHNSAAERLSFDNIPQEILQRAESWILGNPEMFSGYAEMDFAAQKKVVADAILEYLGYPAPAVVSRPVTVPVNTGVFLKDGVCKDRKVDPVVSCPRRGEVGFCLALPKSPQKVMVSKGGTDGNSPFRRTPFADVNKNHKPLSPPFSFSSDAPPNANNYLEQGICVDLAKIIGTDCSNEN